MRSGSGLATENMTYNFEKIRYATQFMDYTDDDCLNASSSKPKEIVVVGSELHGSTAPADHSLGTLAAAAVQRAGGRLIDCEGYAMLGQR